MLQLVEQFGSRIAHLHFSDNHGRRDEHLAVGRGTVDFTGLVRRLQAIGYDDTITLEVFEPDRQLLIDSREWPRDKQGRGGAGERRRTGRIAWLPAPPLPCLFVTASQTAAGGSVRSADQSGQERDSGSG